MHARTLERQRHHHRFDAGNAQGERQTARVVALTLIMMVLEVVAGLLYGSMALLADGWHMGTHAAALGISLFAYRFARRHAENPRFSFGTGKVGPLGGFSSALVLALVALMMIVESVQRLFAPQMIRFDEAIAVAVLGLLVNLLCAWMLRAVPHDHQHGAALGASPSDSAGHNHHSHHSHHSHHGHHSHHSHDHNLKAAYLHVLADALTSLLAIVALLAGKWWGWGWMDPWMGIVGALIILRWGYGLMVESGAILLDGGEKPARLAAIRSAIEADADNRVSDLHIWRVSSRQRAAVISVVTDRPRPPEHYKALLSGFPELVHVSVEVLPCQDRHCGAEKGGARR